MFGRAHEDDEDDLLDEEVDDEYTDEDSGSGEWIDPFTEMEEVADEIFEECEDDVVCIAARLDGLDPEVRWDLLGSNLLNAWQVFYYIFRYEPDDLTRERLELEPALAARTGVLLEHRDLYELIFYVQERRGFIGVSDGEVLISRFEGPDAYEEARTFVDENA